MKSVTKHSALTRSMAGKTFSLFLFISLILFSYEMRSQPPCVANFSFSIGANGLVQFQSTSTFTTTSTSYTWNFGVPYLSTPSGTFATQPVVNYTANGSYVVLLTISSISPSCSSSYTAIVTVTNIPVCILNFSNAPTTTSLACNGSSTVNSVGFCGTISYTWLPGGFNGPVQSSLCAGNYTVLVAGSTTTGSCCPSLTSSIVTISYSPCVLNANFNHTLSAGGLVNFTSTSSGTVSGTTYSWNYGDGSALGTGVTTSHTYSTSGTYSVLLRANNNTTGTCKDSLVKNISVVVVTCSLSPSFTTNLIGNNTISFQSTSTGTLPTSTYTWNFGDGNSATGISALHTYSSSGSYSVGLSVSNDTLGICSSSNASIVPVSTIACNVTSGFSHTIGTGGVVSFSNTSVGLIKDYFWDFGDGFTAISATPQHTYTNAGNYYVKLVVRDSIFTFCKDSLIQAINVTGIGCNAISVFTLFPSGTPQLWLAIPGYPYNVSAAIWSWGDGTSSNGLYSSHVYSTSSTYSICLSVTVSCAATSSFCSSYYISKPGSSASSGFSVNVMSPPLHVGIGSYESQELLMSIFPNPNDGKFRLKFSNAPPEKITIDIQNFLGEQIYHSEIEVKDDHVSEEINLGEKSGIFFVIVRTGKRTFTQKVVINGF